MFTRRKGRRGRTGLTARVSRAQPRATYRGGQRRDAAPATAPAPRRTESDRESCTCHSLNHVRPELCFVYLSPYTVCQLTVISNLTVISSTQGY